MSTAQISIIIPTFNRTEYLAETIDSVLNQTYSNWECIIVDDGSDEENLKFIEKQAARDERIILIRRDRFPKGASTCRNIGISNSKGEYLMFLDSDDLLAKICIENRLNAILKFPELDFMVFPVLLFDNESYLGDTIFLRENLIDENVLAGFLRSELAWCIHSSFWKRQSIDSSVFFNEYFPRFQDVEFNVRMLYRKKKFRVCYESEPDSFYRKNISTNKVKKPINNPVPKSAYLLFRLITPQILSHSNLIPDIKFGYNKLLWNYLLKGTKSLYVDAYIKLGKNNRLISSRSLIGLVIITFLKKNKLDEKKFTGYTRIFKLFIRKYRTKSELIKLKNKVSVKKYI